MSRFLLIIKYVLILGIGIRLYDFIAYYLITNWGQFYTSFLGPKLFWVLAAFPINFITLPFVYFFVYKATRKYILTNPALAHESNKVSFLVWVTIFGLLYGYFESSIINVITHNNSQWLEFYEALNHIGIFQTLLALLIIFIASQKKPSRFEHTIGILASAGLLIAMTVLPVIGGAISQ